MRNRSISEEQLRKIEKIINEIRRKSFGGDYIYRGEHKKHKKISSALYREYFDRKDINVDIEGFDLIRTQREILNIAKKHIGEPTEGLENFIYVKTTDAWTNHITKTIQAHIKAAEELEILTELQHYGGMTNLIDFTTDYFISIFFACSGSPKNVGRVILLEKDEEVEKMIIRPHNPRHRVTAQKSVFLYPPEGYIEVPENNKIFIPTKLKQPLLKYLSEYHNISAETIYNDIHGFIRYQNIHQASLTAFYLGLMFERNGYNAETPEEKRSAYKQAIKHYDKSIKLDSQFGAVYFNRGECWLHLKGWENAKEDFMTATNMGIDIIKAFRKDYNDAENLKKNRY